MDKPKKKPDLRFKGFTDVWEQRKLGEFYEFKNGLNKEKEAFGSGMPIVNFTDVFHNRILRADLLRGRVRLSEDEVNRFRVQEGDLFFTRTSETIEEIGYPAVIIGSPIDTVFSGFVLRGRAIKTDPLEAYFKAYVFFTTEFRREMIRKSSMTTRALTSGTALRQMYFSFPLDMREQKMVGRLILFIDKAIAHHQRKLALLKKLKKFFLQNMFPKDGEKFPNLRFKEFTDVWEQRKLGEIIRTAITNGIMNRPGKNKLNTKDINVVNMYTADYIHINELEYFDATEKDLKKCNVEYGDIFVTRSSLKPEGIAEPNILMDKGNFVFDDHLMQLKLKDEYNPRFIKNLLSSNMVKRQFISKSKTGTMTTIGQDDISSSEISTPEYEEQVKIGDILNTIDETIAHHQRTLDSLKQVKKALLQKMFV